MNAKRKGFIAAFVNILLIFTIFLLRYSAGVTLKIGGAVPMLLIPVIISVSIFFGENAAILYGLFAGFLTDAVTSDSYCFCTVFMVITAVVCNLLMNRFLNRNLKAAVCLSVCVSFGYFFLRFLVSFVFMGVSVNYDYFIFYLIPSVVYTSVWIIPLYFLEKKLSHA